MLFDRLPLGAQVELWRFCVWNINYLLKLTQLVLFFNIQSLLLFVIQSLLMHRAIELPLSMHRVIELIESFILMPRRARALQQQLCCLCRKVCNSLTETFSSFAQTQQIKFNIKTDTKTIKLKKKQNKHVIFTVNTNTPPEIATSHLNY